MKFLQLSLFVAFAAAQSCKPWVLPWGTYNGVFNTVTRLCVYSNVRFASPPLGDLRFAAPEYPPVKPSGGFPTAPGNYPTCYQMEETACSPGGSFGGNNTGCFGDYYGTQSEDCLFLDVHVPEVAFTSPKPLPVVIWIYGGGYLFGSKSQYDPKTFSFYDGTGFVDAASKNNAAAKTSVIWIAGNYRLGAFGWLAGQYMEKNGQPNAGLLDQRAVMNLTYDYISLLNGDRNQISVWGGASSIMHHLAMPENIKNPRFQKAVVQSPAFQWLWDRNGTLNNTFTYFVGNVSQQAGCPRADMNCLRKVATSAVLRKINQELFQEAACDGILPVGPSVDAQYVIDLAPALFAKGQVASIQTIISSHVDLEIPYSDSITSFSFIPRPIRANPQSEAAFDAFLDAVFTGQKYASIRSAIKAQYPLSKYKDQIARAVAVITDSSFTCNSRFMINQYIRTGKPVYALGYAVLMYYGVFKIDAANHAADLLPAFATTSTDYTNLFSCLSNGSSSASGLNKQVVKYTRPGMQQYFTDHAIWGNPNHNNPKYPWSQANIVPCTDQQGKSSTCVGRLMKPQTSLIYDTWSYNDSSDVETSDAICGFWQRVALAISSMTTPRPEHGHMRDEFSNEKMRDQVVFNEEL